MEGSLDKIEKFSAVPIFFEFGDKLSLPFQLAENVFVDTLKGRLQSNNFLVWDRFAPKHAIDWFTEMDRVIVHRFRSQHGTGQKEEDSKDLLHKVFICLRVVRPTRTPFGVVQFRLKENNEPDVLSFVEAEDPVSLLMPESEVLNHLTARDMMTLKAILPRFFTIDSSKDAQNVRRALKYYETGYAGLKDPVLQFIVWMMGIEALFSSVPQVSSPDIIKLHIVEALGSKDIYSDFADRDLYGAKPIVVKDIVDDLFKMRNMLMHGGWVPSEWINQTVRSSISGPAINYADMLREAAPFILRASLMNVLSKRA